MKVFNRGMTYRELFCCISFYIFYLRLIFWIQTPLQKKVLIKIMIDLSENIVFSLRRKINLRVYAVEIESCQ